MWPKAARSRADASLWSGWGSYAARLSRSTKSIVNPWVIPSARSVGAKFSPQWQSTSPGICRTSEVIAWRAASMDRGVASGWGRKRRTCRTIVTQCIGSEDSGFKSAVVRARRYPTNPKCNFRLSYMPGTPASANHQRQVSEGSGSSKPRFGCRCRSSPRLGDDGLSVNSRGRRRDGPFARRFGPPPAQIRACAANALGSYLGCVTSKRSVGQGCRMRGDGIQRADRRGVVSRLMWNLAMAPLRDAALRLCSTTCYAAASSSRVMTSTIFS